MVTAPQSAAVLKLPLVDKTEYEVYQTDIDEWREAYPAVDILQQLKEMKAWCNANPAKLKTRNGIRRFINNWLSREQDSSGNHASVPQKAERISPPPDASKRAKGPTYLPEWAEGGNS